MMDHLAGVPHRYGFRIAVTSLSDVRNSAIPIRAVECAERRGVQETGQTPRHGEALRATHKSLSYRGGSERAFARIIAENCRGGWGARGPDIARATRVSRRSDGKLPLGGRFGSETA